MKKFLITLPGLILDGVGGCAEGGGGGVVVVVGDATETIGGEVVNVGEGICCWVGCFGGMVRVGAVLGGGGRADSPPLVVSVVTLLPMERVEGDVLVVRTEPVETSGSMLSI